MGNNRIIVYIIICYPGVGGKKEFIFILSSVCVRCGGLHLGCWLE